jgi:tetratricopeptide (TPR) repeat protein
MWSPPLKTRHNGPDGSAAEYDLAILHADADRAWVDGYLKHAIGVEPSRVATPRDFRPGAPIPAELERLVTCSRYTVLVLSPALLADRWAQFGEQLVSFTSVDDDRNRVVAVTLHPCQPPLRLRFRVGLDCTDWTTWDEQAARIRSLLDRPAPPAEQIACPYPGMFAFRPEDAGLFHGRDQEIDDLVRLVRQHNFLLVVGPSGSGKSSLVVAGLMPRLADPGNFAAGHWRIRSFRPGTNPMGRLAEQLGGDPHRAGECIGAILETEPPAQRLVIFVDQFEELFTQVKDRAAQEDFISALKSLRGDPRCTVVLGMRVDFYPDVMNSTLWPVDRGQIVDVAPLRGEALRKAIVRPAETVGVYLEEGLVDSLIADAASEPGSLPMLQEALVLLWAKRERRLLTRAAYQAMGREGRSGLAVAMATKADATLARMPPEEQQIGRRIFVRLVEFGQGRPDTRRQLAVDDLRAAADPPGMFDRVLETLIDGRLLTPAAEEQGPRRVDIAHEMLIVGWPTSREWVQARRQAELTRRALETKALEWVRLGKGTGGLLDAAELPEAQHWIAGTDASDLGYSEAFRDLVNASVDSLDSARRRTRRYVRAAIGSLLGALAIMAGLAFWARQEALQAREGQREAQLAEGQAKLAAGQARKAEAHARLATQQTRATAIQIAMQRGDWPQAIELIDSATREKEGDPVALRLAKLRALGAMQRVPEAIREVQLLTELDNKDGYEGNILLWQGDLKWLRSLTLDEPMSMVRKAVKLGLKAEMPGDENCVKADYEYARGMLASSVDESIAHFRPALDLVPSHHRASTMLGNLLLLSGQPAEARVQARVGQTLFPDDPSFKILESWTAITDAERQAAFDRLDTLARPAARGTRPRLTAEQVQSAKQIASLVHDYRNLEATPEPSFRMLFLLGRTMLVAARSRGLFLLEDAERDELFFPAPPVLMRALDDFKSLPGAMRARDVPQLSALLSRIATIDPDGLILVLQGLTAAVDERIAEPLRYRQAEQFFVRAVEARSMVSVRTLAEYEATEMRAVMAIGPRRDESMLKKAAHGMRQLVDAGSVRPYMVNVLVRICCDVADWDRARMIVTSFPGTPGLERLLPRIYLETHSYDLAAEAAAKALEKDPSRSPLRKLRESAIDKMQQELERLKSGPSPVSGSH